VSTIAQVATRLWYQPENVSPLLADNRVQLFEEEFGSWNSKERVLCLAR
jgi:hypothetical protein